MACRLAATASHRSTGLLTLDTLITLVLDWKRPVKIFIETKHPVRYGALVESKVLAVLHRYGIAAPPSADLVSRRGDVVFRGRGVADEARRADAAHRAAGGDVAVSGWECSNDGRGHRGGSVDRHAARAPELVDRAAAQGRALYCWTVDHYEDVRYCRDVGVGLGRPPTTPAAPRTGCRTG